MDPLENDFKWFMQFQGQVQGPFNSTHMQNALGRLDSAHIEKTLVWRRGFAEWVKASKWDSPEHTKAVMTPSELTQSGATLSVSKPTTPTPPPLQKMPQSQPQTSPPSRPAMSSTPPPAVETQIAPDEDTVVGAKNPEPLSQGAFYRVQVNFVDQPMMTKNELLALIAQQEDISVVAIQDPKSKEWKEVYAYPDIVEKLGISRRKHARVPILAQFVGRTNRHDSFHARIITISEGGLGLTEVYDLKIGDEVEGQVTSPHFFQPINIRADVVYSGLDGYIGLNFSQINEESKVAIIDYMKKFGKTTGNPQS